MSKNKIDEKDLKKVAGGGPGSNFEDLYAETNYGDAGPRRSQDGSIDEQPQADGSNRELDQD